MRFCASRAGPVKLRAAALGLALLSIATIAASVPALADATTAQQILKGMSHFLKNQSSLAVKYDADVEVVTPSMEKIQFSASGQATLARPDKFRVTRTGGYADVELVSDGGKLTIFDKNGNRFAQVPAAASFDETVDKLRSEFSLEVPGADLLLTKPYEALTAGVLEAKRIGTGLIEGIECEHLAFRNLDTDWQIWVQMGDHPVPRKYVITSKAVGGAPQYTLRLRDWTFGAVQTPEAYAFTPPPASRGIAVTELTDIDEIPSGRVPGGLQ